MKSRSVIIISALLLLIIFGLFTFYYDKIIPLKQNIKGEKAALQTKKQLLIDYQKKGQKSVDKQENAGDMLPAEASMDFFLLDFNKLLKTYGVVLQTMSESEKKTTTAKLPDKVLAISYNVTLISADPKKMQSFLQALEQRPRLVTIDKIKLAQQSHHAEATLSLTLYWGG